MSRPIGKPVFANCLDENFYHRLRLFCVIQIFVRLCTPSLLPAFPAINATTGTSAPAVVCEALLQLTGAPLAALHFMPVCTFWLTVLQTVLPNACIFNNSRFSSSKPHPACGHLLQRRRKTEEV
jgi:hypothetical protein